MRHFSRGFGQKEPQQYYTRTYIHKYIHTYAPRDYVHSRHYVVRTVKNSYSPRTHNPDTPTTPPYFVHIKRLQTIICHPSGDLAFQTGRRNHPCVIPRLLGADQAIPPGWLRVVGKPCPANIHNFPQQPSSTKLIIKFVVHGLNLVHCMATLRNTRGSSSAVTSCAALPPAVAAQERALTPTHARYTRENPWSLQT